MNKTWWENRLSFKIDPNRWSLAQLDPIKQWVHQDGRVITITNINAAYDILWFQSISETVPRYLKLPRDLINIVTNYVN